MSARRPVKPGDVLGGKYKVDRILGAGGMGVVVAARHTDLGQLVALKFMLKESISDPSSAERFLREAKAAVQLRSIHTARVLDVGRLKNGEPFMVMEYLEGRDLDGELHALGPRPPVVAVDYILQACEALAEAHALGMIHRDVKPKNLFLTRTVDGRALVKILDFGLAKQHGLGGDVSLTATSSVFGSPQYMSPEQMRSAKDADHRSDIWSLGVCLYELLTGRVPFEAEGIAEVCAMVLKDPVPPPSSFTLGIPPDLEAVVLRCLEKDPAHRFQSVAELAYALQSYAADEGSARRILAVMHAAQSAPRIERDLSSLGSPAWGPQAEGARTLNAWDSDPGGGGARTLTRAHVALMTAFAMLGVLATVAVVLLRRPHGGPPPDAQDPGSAAATQPSAAWEPRATSAASVTAPPPLARETEAPATSTTAPAPADGPTSTPLPSAETAPRKGRHPASRPTAPASPRPARPDPGERM